MGRLLVIVFIVDHGCPGNAQKLFGRGGCVDTGDSSYPREPEYREEFGRYFATGFACLNEVHASTHQRGCYAFQLCVQADVITFPGGQDWPLIIFYTTVSSVENGPHPPLPVCVKNWQCWQVRYTSLKRCGAQGMFQNRMSLTRVLFLPTQISAANILGTEKGHHDRTTEKMVGQSRGAADPGHAGRG